jgi:hypothetical protein
MEYQGRRRGCYVDKMEVGKKRSLHSPAVGIRLASGNADPGDAIHDYSNVYGWSKESQEK